MATEKADECSNAVTIRNAYKTFDEKHSVLHGLNMTVRQGTIYGLLGPSGCGKSTLLNSIVGVIGLDSGTIELSVNSKTQVGFMPQALCLYDQLTTEELLNYYGTMYGMNLEKKRAVFDVMFKVLDLPDKDLCPPQLSGGQKRRVSLAIALIHDPKLLILDEPTVGIDPLLRERAWEFLNDWIRPGGKTIIMTTHYIDEARHTDTVGLMRDGMMLCEKSPELIMKDCGTNYLEEAFLKLCYLQQQQENNDNITRPVVLSKRPVYSPLLQTGRVFNAARFEAEVRKNILYLWRNLAVTFFILGLPLISIYMFYIGCGREPRGLSLAVVNDEVPAFKFCDNYIQATNCSLEYLSCRYLHKLKEKSLVLDEYNTVEEALEHLKDTGAWGVVYFSADFTNALALRIQEPLLRDDVIINNSTISIHLDKSNKIISEMLDRDLRLNYLDVMKSLYIECNLSINHVKLPIKFEKPVYGDLHPDYREFMAPALMILLMFGLPLTYGVIIIVEEKNSGSSGRSLVAGTSLFEILAGHTVVQVAVQVFQTLTCCILMYGILRLPFKQPLLSLLLLVLQGLSGVAYAFTLSTTMDSLISVHGIGTGSFVISLIIGGLLWPIEAVHPYLKPIAYLAPNSYSTLSFRSLTLKGWDLMNKDVSLGFVSCIAWTIIFTLITFLYLKKTKAKSFLTNAM